MTSSISALDTSDKRILGQVLSLIPAFDLAPFEKQLVDITRQAMRTRLGQEEWMSAGVWNDGHVLACILRCLNEVSHTTVGEKLRAIVWETALDDLITAWGWNREIMEELASIVEITPGL
jgi:hypothetical protein